MSEILALVGIVILLSLCSYGNKYATSLCAAQVLDSYTSRCVAQAKKDTVSFAVAVQHDLEFASFIQSISFGYVFVI